MKKYIFLFSAILALQVKAEINANRLVERTMSVSLSPFQLLQLSLDGKYLVRLDERVALIVPFVVQYIPQNELFKLRDVIFLSSGAGARYHFFNRAFESGLYTELSFSLGYSQVTPMRTASFASGFFRSTASLGYSWVFASGLLINFGGGLFYNYAFSDEAPVLKKVLSAEEGTGLLKNFSTTLGLTSGFSPTAEISLGYAW